ncbi:MAG TPA: ABC transporter ATP-binding protein [Candidatus Dormibacteraeota bacterium]
MGTTGQAIAVEGVSKRYRIYEQRHQSLKEAIVKRGFGSWHELWALKDVSFEIPRGQVLGIIGRNGSGKSTLLKMLSGIIAPDSGQITINGRVSSLLELGAGFQPEYTGRENVFLYGAILGLRRREIDRRFDEIVGFAELGDFIDTPVKNYSSGMYMRLGFAVAVTLDPEILLIDEVLAVGDSQFQMKCFAHLRKLRREGVTIVLVSHDLDSVNRFCERAVWLDGGRLAAEGPTDRTIQDYLESAARHVSEGDKTLVGPQGGRLTGDMTIQSVRYLDENGRQILTVNSGQPVTLEVRYTARRPLEMVDMDITFFRNDGVRCLDTPHSQALPGGEGVIRLHFPSLSLGAGLYDVTIALYDPIHHGVHQYHDRMYPFTVQDPRAAPALVWLPYQWEVAAAAAELRD